MFIQDSFDNEVVLMFNEERKEVSSLFTKYGKEHSEHYERPKRIVLQHFSEDFINACIQQHVHIGRDYIPHGIGPTIKRRVNILEFAEHGIKEGRDWVFFHRKEWEDMQPKPKRKFIKPRKR
jgi:hypothetical protein